MMDEPSAQDVDQFILDEIDSVPHLEALLLLWNRRPKLWTDQEIARALYVAPSVAQKILHDLISRRLVAVSTGNESETLYECQVVEKASLLDRVDATYRRELVRVSTLIHSKASAAVRDFAKAFRFTKDRE